MQTFLQWGAAAASSPVSTTTLMHPSSVIDAGFQAVLPIQQLMDRSAGWVAVWNYGFHIFYSLAKATVLISFFLVALHLGALVAGAAGGLRGVLVAQAAIRGLSTLVRRR